MERVRDAAGRYVRLARPAPYNVLVAAEQLSAVGDAITLLALPIFVFGATGSPVAAGVALAARSLPWVFVGPAVAVWTDRANRQAIMVACDVGRAALVGSLFLVDQLPAVVAVALGTGTLSAIQRSARASLIPAVVTRDDYPTATSLQRTLLVAGTALGSALGGVVIARVGARYGFLVDAATFAASAALVLVVRVPAALRRGAGGGGTLEGWRQVFGHARLGYALLATVVASTLNGSAALLATRAQAEVFHADASAAGALLAVASIGVAVGSIATPGLIGWLGARGALIAAGAILPVLVVLLWPSLRRIDAEAMIAEEPLELLRRIAIFAQLPEPVLERLAAAATTISVAADGVVVSRGEVGNHFYAIAAGKAVVELADGTTRELGPGDSFGEIALLRNVPRTATVRALEPLQLFALERDEFILAVTGHAPTAATAEKIVMTRLPAGALAG